MFARLLPTLLALCLLASLNGFGAHVHWHSHGNEATHSHVVSALAADHLQAHVEGSQDDDGEKLGGRNAPDLPQLVATPTSTLTIPAEGAPTLLPLLAEQRVTGPPGHWKPPSQAPPQASLIV